MKNYATYNKAELLPAIMKEWEVQNKNNHPMSGLIAVDVKAVIADSFKEYAVGRSDLEFILTGCITEFPADKEYMFHITDIMGKAYIDVWAAA